MCVCVYTEAVESPCVWESSSSIGQRASGNSGILLTVVFLKKLCIQSHVWCDICCLEKHLGKQNSLQASLSLTGIGALFRITIFILTFIFSIIEFKPTLLCQEQI